MQKLVRFSKPSVHLQSAAVCTCLRLWDLAAVGLPRPQPASVGRRQLSHWAKETGRGCKLGMPCMARKLRRKIL